MGVHEDRNDFEKELEQQKFLQPKTDDVYLKIKIKKGYKKHWQK